MKKLKLFQVDDTLASYTYPLIKNSGQPGTDCFFTNRNSFFRIEKRLWNNIITGICFPLAVQANRVCAWLGQN